MSARRSVASLAAAFALTFALPIGNGWAQTTVTSERPASFTLGNGLQVVVIPDRRTPVAAHLSMRLLDFSGREVWRRDDEVRLAPNASHVLVTVPKREILAGGADPKAAVLVVELTEAGRRLSRNTLTFVKTKDLALPASDVHADVEARADGAFTVRLTSRRYARDVMLSTTDNSSGAVAVDGAFDDNVFDLFPGETATVTFHPRTSTTAEAFRAALKVVSLVDSY